MKITRLLTITLLFVFGIQAQNTAEEIIKLEEALSEAERKRDLAFLDRHIADDYVWTTRSGNQMDKKEYLRRNREGTGLLANAPGATSTRENVKVRVFENTAVVTGISNYKSKERALRINFTAVWAKLAGRWQLIAAHSSVPPTP